MFSTWLANAIKFVFNIPRPADSRLRIPWPETTPSFLSGHALSAVANWGFVALRFRNPVVTILAVIAIIGIPLSRMFLGVHFPQDIIGGLLLGFLLLIVFNGAEPSVSRWLSRQTVPVQLALAIAVPVLLIFVHPADPAAGYPARGAVQTMSALVGLGIGLVMDRAWLRFSVDGTLLQRLVRLLLGLLLVAVFYVGPRLIVPDGLAYGAELGITFLHYALLGWTTAFLAPWLFCKVGLAGHESPVSAAAAPSTPAADASRPG
jgi:hypothetical protein